jgi:hypothetical protein
MARIRTIKPEFFRHELLQEMESQHGELRPMLVFVGLWTVCDKNGVFAWRPRQLKLDILPFLNFSMKDALEALEKYAFIDRYEVDGKSYGIIKSFSDHQRITGTEAKAEGKHPLPSVETTRKQQGNTLETTGQQLGRLEKEKEKERERERSTRAKEKKFLPPSEQEVIDYFVTNGYSPESGQHAFQYYDAGNWRDSKSNPVKNWKQKMIAVWFKPENRPGNKEPPRLTTKTAQNMAVIQDFLQRQERKEVADGL